MTNVYKTGGIPKLSDVVTVHIKEIERTGMVVAIRTRSVLLHVAGFRRLVLVNPLDCVRIGTRNPGELVANSEHVLIDSFLSAHPTTGRG